MAKEFEPNFRVECAAYDNSANSDEYELNIGSYDDYNAMATGFERCIIADGWEFDECDENWLCPKCKDRLKQEVGE